MADLVLVPREPTEEQLEAGLDASGNRVSASPADYIDGAMVEPGMSEAEAAEINGWLKDALRDEYKAMIASAPSQEVGWRTIDSAPKGRKLICGSFNPLGKWRSYMASYYLPGTLESSEACYTASEDEFAPEGWYEESETHDEILPIKPTHWQPLPLPPTDSIRSFKKRDGSEKM